MEALLLPAREQLEKALAPHPVSRERSLSEMARVIAESILQALTAQVNAGNNTGVAELLSGRETAAGSPEVQELLPPVAANLAQRLGVPKTAARNIALFSIPVVFNLLNSRILRARQSGLDLEEMLCSLKGASYATPKPNQADLIHKVLENLLKQ